MPKRHRLIVSVPLWAASFLFVALVASAQQDKSLNLKMEDVSCSTPSVIPVQR